MAESINGQRPVGRIGASGGRVIGLLAPEIWRLDPMQFHVLQSQVGGSGAMGPDLFTGGGCPNIRM